MELLIWQLHKSQITSTKLQINFKYQYPMTQTGDLEPSQFLDLRI
jgi:hypothetical protein